MSIHEHTSLEKIDLESMVRFLLADKMRFIFDKIQRIVIIDVVVECSLGLEPSTSPSTFQHSIT